MVESSYIGVAEVSGMVWIRRWFVLSLAFGLCVVLVALLLLVRPIYRAQLLIEIVSSNQHGMIDEPAPLASALNESLVVATEADKIASDTVARAVFQANKTEIVSDLAKSGWPTGLLTGVVAEARNYLCGPGRSAYVSMDSLCPPAHPGRADELLFVKFRKGVSVEPRHGTSLVQLSYSASDPVLAANIANAFEDEYIRESVDIADRRNNRFNDWIKSRLIGLAASAHAADEAVAHYRNATGLYEMRKESDSARRSPAIEQLSILLQQLGAAKAERATTEAKLNQIKAAQTNPELAESLPEIVDSPVLVDLTRQSVAISGRLALLANSYSSGHPIVQHARAELDGVQAARKREVARILHAAATRYENVMADVTRLNREVSDAERTAARELANRVSLSELELTAKSASDLYESFLRTANDSVERSTWQPVNVVLVAKATPPVRPYFPDMRLMLPLSATASLFLSALTAIIIEIRRQRRVFFIPGDLERMTGVAVIGSVPRTRRSIATTQETIGYTMAIEDLALRLGGTTWISSRSSNVVAVLSAMPGEGKSILSSSLAKRFSEFNQRVLLVDADLRRPSHFDAEPCDDQKHVLGWTRDRPLRFVAKTGVYVLSLAEIGRPPLAILAEVPSIISEMQEHFSVVVIDTPPILAVSDALSVTGPCNHILFAVRWGVTPKQAVVSALSRLSEADRRRTEAVFTRVDPKKASLYDAPGLESTRLGPYYLALATAAKK